MKIINPNAGKVINLDNFDCVNCRQSILSQFWLVLAERKYKGLLGTETIEETIAEFNNPEYATALANDIANAWAAGNPSFNLNEWMDKHKTDIKTEPEQTYSNINDPMTLCVRNCAEILRQHKELSDNLK